MGVQGNRIDWDDFRVFAAAARRGSYRGASRELGITAQAVGRRIAGLEAKLGQRLFLRVPHGLELTPEGQRILGYANAAETVLSRASSLAHDATETIEGECRVGLGDGIATYWLPRFLPRFFQAHPHIALLTYASVERTNQKSPNHDIQIQYADTLDESLVAQPVAMLHFMLFGSRDYLEKNGTPRTMEDLSRHRLVDFSLVGSDKGTFAAWRGLTDRTAFIANSTATHCESVRWGAGIGMLPTYTAALLPELVPVIPDVHFPTPVYLCFEREGAKRPAVRATLNFLKEVMFNPDRMPWFQETLAVPEREWQSALRRLADEPTERHLMPVAV